MDQYINDENLINLIKSYKAYIPVILGCVDNDKTRKIIEKVINDKDLKYCYYIDSANSEYEGNVYTVSKKQGVITGKLRSQVYKLDEDKHPDEVSCQDQAANGNIQYLVTNAKMAVTVLEHCHALLKSGYKEGVQVVKRFETVFY